MSACALRDSLLRLCAAALLVCVAAAVVRAQDDAQTRVRELFDARELGQALNACDELTDPVLRAEWRFAVLYAGGDLTAAMNAALDGLEHAPGHAGLGYNALVCALRLRSPEVAAQVRAQLATTPPELAPDLERLSELDRSAASITRRARIAALASLLAAALAMVWLARQSDA